MKANKTHIPFFREKILFWHYELNKRSHSWSGTKDPYKIWLSEIIMQQTRIEQGLPYYLRFVEHYPGVEDLAAANDEEVFLLWEGLGYYSRCRNLLFTARQIVEIHNGQFPNSYPELLKLKGVGPYTAAAIASFAFDQPTAVLDGNVFRVLSRFFGIETPIDSTDGKKEFTELANTVLDTKHSADFNQGIMDFGASVCKPQNPECGTCILNRHCFAYKQNLINVLPVKSKKLKIKTRQFHYLILRNGHKIFIHQRLEKDIWQGLYEFFLIETVSDFEMSDAWKELKPHIKEIRKNIFSNKQRLTHQIINSKFHEVQLNSSFDFKNQGLWIEYSEIDKYAFPKTMLDFLRHYTL